MKPYRRVLWLEVAALLLFLAGFWGEDRASRSTQRFVVEVSAGGLFLIGTLLLVRTWVVRGWRGGQWAKRLRALLSPLVFVMVGRPALTIAVVALLSLGKRESLGLPAAILLVVAEVGVLVSAARSFS